MQILNTRKEDGNWLQTMYSKFETFTDVCLAGWQLLPHCVRKFVVFQKGISPKIFNILFSYFLQVPILVTISFNLLVRFFVCQAKLNFS